MNAGFSNLATLKAWLLPPALAAATDYDAQILAIGRGAAAQLEGHCNRKFPRVVGDLYETTADRLVVILPRYPVEVISKVEIRNTIAEGWIDQGNPDQILFNRRDQAGILDIGGWLGGRYQRLRFTFTGGYFFEQLEPADTGYPTAQPSGSAALPDDLALAWRLQCEHIRTQRDKLGLSIAEQPKTLHGVVPNLASIQILPQAVNLVRELVRYSMV